MIGSVPSWNALAWRQPPHVLRHTAVTWMVQENVPMQMIARFAGVSVAMIEKRYGHHSPDYLRQAANALAG
jgi:integrase